MTKDNLIPQMVPLLQDAVDQHESAPHLEVAADSPLIGRKAVLTSLALVAFICDVEMMLAEVHSFEVTLVSEHAFSRSKSPFRSIDSLAEYIAELAASRYAA